ncbi:MAG: UDP-glucose dehydrogenase family protein [Ancrocorticia sp.]|uniref:UDP-glucose dehydrogenase family protein n=1 Tax=Ancrocorticia sp. TaxID=2593684 RepID=UPI003F8E06A3
MHIAVIGCGYLGAVHAASMAELGHTVVGIDVDPIRIQKLAQGVASFVEPGFDELLERNVASGRLTFSTDFASTRFSELYFIGVGTPQREDSHAADLTYVHEAIDSLLPYLEEGNVIAGKSTVPVGTAADLEQRIATTGASMVWNPEFLREGFAVKDTLEPDRVVYGLSTEPKHAKTGQKALDECYAMILETGTPRLLMDFQTAELVKVSANSFLATKISFINAMAQICDATGADVTMLANAIGLDDRIGKKFLRAGIGFGGGCLPKDIRAFHTRAEELGLGDSLNFLSAVEDINDNQATFAIDTTQNLLGGSLNGKKIAVLGAAFKPNSDDMRHSPARLIAELLEQRGATVVVTDPAAGPVLAEQGTANVAGTPEAAIRGTDATFLATEWKQFSDLDPSTLMPAGKIVIDGRNALDPHKWKAAGWIYQGIGRR